jgi:PAS domain-containing protein
VFSATLGGLLHDLGKLYIPDAVLKKPGRLTDAEYATIKEHPVFAWMLLAGLSTLKSISEVAIAHHEGWDGSGYPNGTAGEDIPLGARITAIADTYDAMTSDRPYRPALPHAEAVVEIKKSAGRRFDPRLAEKFIRMVEEWGFDRESLVAPLGALEATASEDYSLRWTPEAPPLRPADTGGLDRLLASGAFIDTALNNTPAFYSLVSEDYDVLYVSDNYAEFMGRPRRELLAGKCFEMVGKKEPCYMVDGAAGADGALCSVARAFATGERQYSLITEDIRGERLYYDNYAIPTELEGPGGERVRCCLEILFDRTAEKSVQRSFEGDLRHLMEKLRGMAEEVLPKDSENIRGITDETDRCIAYLDGAVSSISEPQWL